MPERVDLIRGQVDAATAAGIVGDLSGQPDAADVECTRYYPYYRFAAECRLPTLFGAKRLTVDCLVDGVNALAATADRSAIERCMVARADLVSLEVDEAQARRAAVRTLSHRLGRKLRVIAPIDAELGAASLVYKRFWIVRAAGARAEVRVMVDSITGAVLPLLTRAA